jgi:hypothetical protein
MTFERQRVSTKKEEEGKEVQTFPLDSPLGSKIASKLYAVEPRKVNGMDRTFNKI